MSSYKRFLTNQFSFGRYTNNPSQRFEFLTTNLMDVYYDQALGGEEKQKFKAVCLSGIRTNDNNGSGVDENDGTQVGNFIRVKIRRLDSYGSCVVDPLNFDDPTLVNQAISINGAVMTAESDYTIDQTNAPLFGQILECYKDEEGNIRFMNPGPSGIQEGYEALSTIEGVFTNLSDIFNRGISSLLGIPTPVDFSNLSASDNIINQPWQIPNSIPPIDTTKTHRITSTMGNRINPLDPSSPGVSSHAGIDIAQPINSPLFAIFDGDIVAARGSGISNGFIMDPVYGKVGTSGYGLIVVVRHKVPTNSGEMKTIFCEYGHIQDMFVKEGDKVKQGQQIASIGNRGGSTGPHLHLTVRYNAAFEGKKADPLSLFGWYNRITWKSDDYKQKWAVNYPEFFQN